MHAYQNRLLIQFSSVCGYYTVRISAWQYNIQNLIDCINRNKNIFGWFFKYGW